MSDVDCVCRVSGRLRQVQFVATLRRPERREALLFLLYSIVEHAEEASAAELGLHLFGPGRTAATERLLAIARRWDLVYESGGQWSLTEVGTSALRQRSILVPKLGVWNAHFLDAGDIGSALITLEEVASARLQSAKDETISAHAKQQASHVMAPFIGAAMSPVAGGAEAIIEAEPEPTGILLSDLETDITWYPLSGRMQFGRENWTASARSCDLPELLHAVRPDLSNMWDKGAGALAVSADELLIDALFSRRLRIEGERVHVHALGTVQDMELSLPCQPLGDDDAARWVERRATVLATELQTPAVWEETLRTAASDLDEFEPIMPTRSTVATRAKLGGNLPEYWNLVAADDWRVA